MKSSVTDKQYFSYKLGSRLSRPINKALFVTSPRELRRLLRSFVKANFHPLTVNQANRVLYTLAMAFCAATDVQKTLDKKTPATYFEILIGNIFSRLFGVLPVRRVDVLNLDMEASLPTDLIYDLGPGLAKLHVPVKTSTRERVIQVWAHQRVLDGVYGTGRFKGILVVLTETKLDTEKLEVVEICLPEQWKIYQLFISRLERVYYLDVPTRYHNLAASFPKIEVKQLGELFQEAESLKTL